VGVWFAATVTRRVVGVFVRFRAPLQPRFSNMAVVSMFSDR
jgi:hypothetical protein